MYNMGPCEFVTGSQIYSEVSGGPSKVCVCVFVVPVERSAGGHTPGEALDSQLSEIRHGGEVGGHDGHRVRRVHEEGILPEDHVAVLRKRAQKTDNETISPQPPNCAAGFLIIIPLVLIGLKLYSMLS